MVHLPFVNNKVNIYTINGNNNIQNDKIDNNNQLDKTETYAAYDPFQHRSVKRPISDQRALLNLLKSSLGSGILAMPLAFSCSGIIIGVIGTILIGIICTHCAQIIVKQSQDLCCLIEKPSLGYAETCEQAFANGPVRLRKYSNFVRIFTDFAMALTYLGSGCVYVVLIANSIEQLVETHSTVDYLSSTYCLMLLVPLALIVQINNLKHLAPFSAIANVLLIGVCGISFYFIFEGKLSLENRELYVGFTKMPLFISTVIFAMEGIGVVMPIENEMSKPRHFLGCPGVLNISMTIVVVLYMTLGLFGYLKYGNDALGSITLNLDINSVVAKVAKGFIIVAIFFTYPLQYYVCTDIIWKYVKPKVSEKYQKFAQVVLLTSGVVTNIIIGAVLPKIDAIIEIIGSIFYSTLGLFIPALIETVFRWDKDLGRMKWVLWKNIFIMVFAVVALVCGLSHAVSNLIS